MLATKVCSNLVANAAELVANEKICSEMTSFDFPEVNQLFDEYSAKTCKVKKFQLQSISNEETCIDKWIAVKSSSIQCLALILNLSNPGMTIMNTDTTIHLLLFSVN